MLKIFALLVICFWPWQSLAEVRLVELKYRNPADLVEPVRDLLGADGKVAQAGNHLLLVAEGEQLKAAEKLIKLLDRPLRQYVVRIKQEQRQQVAGAELSTAVRYGTGTGFSGAVAGQRHLGNSQENLEQFLTVSEGSGGWLEVGRDIPYTAEWAAFSGEQTGYAERIDYRSVTAGFWVWPLRIANDQVLVEIEPRIQRLTAGGEGGSPPQVATSQLRSKLQIPMGEWYPLGRQLQATDDLSRAILAWRSARSQGEQELLLRIDLAPGFSP